MSTFKVIYCDKKNNNLMEPTVVTYGKVSYLRKNETYKEGYRFKGWYAYRISDNTLNYICKNGKTKFYKVGKQPKGWIPHLFLDECKVARLSKVDGDVVMMRAQWERCLLDAPEHASENKDILREKLLHRPIVLFGRANKCKNFYLGYYEKLNIRCILTNKREEEKIKLKDGTVLRVEPYCKEKIQPDDYVIVCCPVRNEFDEQYKNARSVLLQDGYEHVQDFVRMGVAKAILDEKKIWLWLGYCQFDKLREIFRRVAHIDQAFELFGMRYGRDTIKTSYKFYECQDMMKLCDVLVYIPLIVAEGKIDFDFMKFLPKDATLLSTPRTTFRGYYPYKDDDLETHHKYSYDRQIHWPFNYAENFLDELILKGFNDNEIYEEVMRDDFINESVIRKNLKLAYKSIQISEATTDVQILDYIKDNFTKHMLYRDGLHYQNDLYFELARRISEKLDLNAIDILNDLEREMEDNGQQYIDFTEIPVLPCVAKVLGLDFITDDTLWRVKITDQGEHRGTKHEIRMMTRKEWIYAYVAYTRAQMTLGDFWNLKKQMLDSDKIEIVS